MLRQLEYFVALARERHFARAAEACFVSQPTLSESIRKLEAELGVPLVRRGHSFQGLTPEGEQVLQWARRMLLDHKSLLQEVQGLHGGLRGSLRLGAVPAVTSTLVQLTDPFARRHELVSVSLETSLRSPQIVQRVRDFDLDAGLVYATDQDVNDLLVLPLYSEEHVLITGPGMLAEADVELAWSDALEFPLCLLDRSMRGRKVLDEALAQQGLQAAPRIESDSVMSLLAHVATGHWASIVPRQWLDSLGAVPGIAVRSLGQPQVAPTISLVLAALDPLPLMSRALLEVAQEVFRPTAGKV